MRRFARVLVGGMFVASMSMGPGVGIAQDTTTDAVVFESVPQGPELATELEIEAEDLGVEEPNWLSNIRRVVSRFFTRNQVKKARIDLELANITLLRARQALVAGDEARAQELVDAYNEQTALASTKLQELVDQLGTTDADVAALLNQATEDNLLQASTLDSLSLKATREFNQKILRARIQALKLLSDLLLKENLTPERLAARVEQLSRVLERKETKAQEKYVRRLAVAEEIDEVSDDDELEGAIEETEDEVEDEIADLDDEDEIGDIADEIASELDNHLVVLQDLLDKVPEPARAAIQRILDRQLAEIRSDAAKNPKVLDELLIKKNEREAEVLKKMIERLKETLKDDEDAKKELENQEKAVERMREANKKRIEAEREDREGSDSSSEDSEDDSSDDSTGDDEDDDRSGSGS